MQSLCLLLGAYGMLQARAGQLGEVSAQLTRRCCALASTAATQPQQLRQLPPQLLSNLIYGWGLPRQEKPHNCSFACGAAELWRLALHWRLATSFMPARSSQRVHGAPSRGTHTSALQCRAEAPAHRLPDLASHLLEAREGRNRPPCSTEQLCRSSVLDLELCKAAITAVVRTPQLLERASAEDLALLAAGLSNAAGLQDTAQAHELREAATSRLHGTLANAANASCQVSRRRAGMLLRRCAVQLCQAVCCQCCRVCTISGCNDTLFMTGQPSPAWWLL